MIHFNSIAIITIIFIITLAAHTCLGQTILSANGDSKNTYKLLNSVLGGTAYEVPDCGHKFQHIQQKNDSQLKRPVFVFYIHVNLDDDTCTLKDRQRNEIKTYNPSPDYLKGFKGETVKFSWNFKLDSGFQPSTKFTHIHQIKDEGGDDKTPIMTLSPRKKTSGNILEVIHVGSSGTKNVLKTIDLQPLLGQWIHVNEEIKYSSTGKYSLSLTRLSDKKQVLSYSNGDIDMWRSGASYVRPKWGIYRGLGDKSSLRDEAVLFDSFCLAKGNDKCD